MGKLIDRLNEILLSIGALYTVIAGTGIVTEKIAKDSTIIRLWPTVFIIMLVSVLVKKYRKQG